jgi:hypothetical protein
VRKRGWSLGANDWFVDRKTEDVKLLKVRNVLLMFDQEVGLETIRGIGISRPACCGGGGVERAPILEG